MTTAEANKYLTFYSMCNFMTDFIEDKWVRSNGNIKKVKYLTNQLKPELEKSINHIFQAKETEGVHMSNVLDQFGKIWECTLSRCVRLGWLVLRRCLTFLLSFVLGVHQYS